MTMEGWNIFDTVSIYSQLVGNQFPHHHHHYHHNHYTECDACLCNGFMAELQIDCLKQKVTNKKMVRTVLLLFACSLAFYVIVIVCERRKGDTKLVSAVQKTLFGKVKGAGDECRTNLCNCFVQPKFNWKIVIVKNFLITSFQLKKNGQQFRATPSKFPICEHHFWLAHFMPSIAFLHSHFATI